MAETYDSSDEALFRLVDVDELDGLLRASGRPVARDSGKLVHLLKRMRATLEADRATVAGLHKHISQVTDHLQRVGRATTLNPMDALRYLDDDQRELLFDRIARDRLAMLRRMIEQAEETRESLVGELEQVRSAAGSIAQRADLPPDVRAEFTRLLAFLPSEVRPVHRPPLLDFPDPEPRPEPVAAPARRTGALPPTAAPSGPWAGPTPAVAGSSTAAEPDPHPAPAATAEPPVYVDPYAPAPDTVPVYVDPYAPPVPHDAGDGAHPGGQEAPVYVDPYASAGPADQPAYVDPYAPVDTTSPAYVDPYAPADDTAGDSAAPGITHLFD